MLRKGLSHASFTLYHLTMDLIRLLGSFLQSRFVLAAENIFLRKQLSLYQERQVRPHRATDAARLTMILVAKLFDWRAALITVRPETLVGWHRKGFLTVLALEIPANRQTKDHQRSSWPYLVHGAGQSHLGTGSHG
jgi:hypothetical protein